MSKQYEAPLNKDHCKQSVQSDYLSHQCCRYPWKDGWKKQQCCRYPWKDGWCYQHHPDSVAKRKKQSQRLYEQQCAKRDKPFKRISELEILAYAIAHKAYEMGRIYTKSGEKATPATEEFRRVNGMVAKKIGVTLETVKNKGKE